MFGVGLAVDRAMAVDAAQEANEQVTQELAEFRQFVSEGRDPGTARPFSTPQRLMEVYLQRQRPSDEELLFGYLHGQPEPTILEVSGAHAADAKLRYDLLDDPVMVAQLLADETGIAETPVGEIRWGIQNITAGNRTATFATVVFLEPANQSANEINRALAGASLGALGLAAAIAYLIAGQILRPVRDVREAATQITEEDLSRRIPVTSQDEVGELTIQFNGMLDRLEQAFAAEQRFIDDAGHELRTPITVVRGQLELMGDDPEEREATIALVTQELDRMSRIVSDLLSLAKSDRPDFIQPEQGVDVASLTLDIDAKMQALGHRRWMLRGIADGTCTLDAQRVTQAVLQLAQNAVQHTAEGGVISLESRFDRDTHGHILTFLVTDDGPGVHPDEAERIFERFARGRKAVRETGAGLGLAIVSAIARSHEGKAFVESQPGQGATFGIAIPVGDYSANSGDDDEDLPADDVGVPLDTKWTPFRGKQINPAPSNTGA